MASGSGVKIVGDKIVGGDEDEGAADTEEEGEEKVEEPAAEPAQEHIEADEEDE